jgi:hypothetical protein
VWDGRYGDHEIPFGVDYATTLIRSSLRHQRFQGFFWAVLYWQFFFIVRHL